MIFHNFCPLKNHPKTIFLEWLRTSISAFWDVGTDFLTQALLGPLLEHFWLLFEHFWRTFGLLLDHFWSTFGLLYGSRDATPPNSLTGPMGGVASQKPGGMREAV